MKRILVIKLGALGDFVQAFPPFAAIRAHHPEARITLLTTRPFVGLATASPWFDAVALDRRLHFWQLHRLAQMRRRLAGYDFVYDLQTSRRSSRYHDLAGRPPWSGIARGASHPDADPRRDRLHTRARQAGQLARAGIAQVPDPDLGWLAAADAAAAPPTVLLVPGASPHRPGKRWPVAQFGALARLLQARGLRPVIVGGADEAPLAAAILAVCPTAQDLTGRTSLLELAALASRASLAVGNDTGPMHLAAALGCPAVVLFSRDSDPALTAPLGRTPGQVAILRAPDLAGLPVVDVADAAATVTAGRSDPPEPGPRPRVASRAG